MDREMSMLTKARRASSVRAILLMALLSIMQACGGERGGGVPRGVTPPQSQTPTTGQNSQTWSTGSQSLSAPSLEPSLKSPTPAPMPH